MKIRPVGAKLLHADVQTYEEANSRFSQFANVSNTMLLGRVKYSSGKFLLNAI
jgi:hypothetical protein